MNILLIYCHPCAESFTAAVRDRALSVLKKSGHDVQLLDLYAEGFNPVMSAAERRGYHTPGDNEIPVSRQIEQIKWAQAMVFVYPTWWFGLPAMLKGWLDRVWVPHVTFAMPEQGKTAQPLMTHVQRIVVLSSCGAPWWMMALVGNPGRRTILRGVRSLCARRCKTKWLAHYKIDTSTKASRTAFLDRVARSLARI
ncbi:MAG: NAD(P)H-dependent oxidoreductase [Alphaproteobacteria bacterium]